jgi:hypothetical protein
MDHASRWRLTRLLAAITLAMSAEIAVAQNGFISMGAEIDDESGYLVLGAIGGSFSANTTWDLAAARADTSAGFASLASTSYDGSVYHDFGVVGLRFGLGGWVEDDFVQADTVSAAFDFHGAAWSVTLQTEFRQSDLEPFDINRTIIRRDGSLLTISARADCEFEDTGIGARLGWSNASWDFDIGGMSFDYDDFGCGFNSPALDILRSATRDEFVQLADSVTDFLSLSAGRYLLLENSFLDSRLSANLSYDSGAHLYRVRYDRIEDVFFGRTADTLSGGIGFALRSGKEIEVYAGITESDAQSNIVFLGVFLLLPR